MSGTKLIFAALLGFVALSLASNVVDLTPDNFDSYVDGSRGAFVEFYAPWCGHCKRLAPDYEIVADAFANLKDKVVVAKVDADAHKELGSRFDVKGFPTLKYFPQGSTQPEDYKGGRDIDSLIEFINNKAGTHARVKKAPTAAVQLDSDNFDSIVLDTNKDVVVEFYASWCGHCKTFAPEYEKIAKAFQGDEDVVIAQVDADKYKDVGQRYEVSGFPTIKFFPKNNKESPEDVAVERTVPAFVSFVNEKTGTARTVSGDLSPQAGRVAELDDLAGRFVEASAEERASLLQQAQDAAATITGRFADAAKHYVKTMQQIIEKGTSFPATERARVQRLLSSGSVKPGKASEFAVKTNILAAFE